MNSSSVLGQPEGFVAERLARYAELLRASPHNLLSPRGLEELESRHFPEAVAFAKQLPEGSRVLDLGSGGGLPGLVVAIVRPDLSVHLLDATKKKTDFLSETASALGVPVTVHHGRAEERSKGDLADAYDVVTARAVAALERLAPLAAPFLRVGGRLHAIKGQRWMEELAQAESAIRQADLRVVSTPSIDARAPEEHRPLTVVLERVKGLVEPPKNVR